jgi:peroxiredoxin
MDEVELRLAHRGLNGSANGLDVVGIRKGPNALAAGTQVAAFQLPDRAGKTVSLEDFRGKPVLLVNWNPGCGYCDLVAPELARLQPALRERDVQVLLLAQGGALANRILAEEHGLEFPILLLADDAPGPELFRDQGTPVAYLLDREGKIQKPLATGYDQVAALAGEAAEESWKRTRLPGEKPLSQSKIERNGLKAGTVAPRFTLPDLSGRDVSLESYRGRRVLLVFSDAHCGPCDQLAPHLVRLHRQSGNGGVDLLLVGRGDLEENRAKAEAHGFEFPVVVQRRWELSKEYGIFATPVAFLIDEDGVISRSVARGVDEILALARAALSARAEVANERALR